MVLTLIAAAPKGPLDTWSPTLLALFALLLPLIALIIVLAFTVDSRRVSAWIAVIFTLAAAVCTVLVVVIATTALGTALLLVAPTLPSPRGGGERIGRR